MKMLRMALAQINSTVGDLRGNSKKISEYLKKAKRLKADLIAFPELAVTGYPPEDLVLKLVDAYHKIVLPNYGVFDEHRYFTAGRRLPLYNFNGIKIGVTICEDIWYKKGPLQTLSHAGADIIVNIGQQKSTLLSLISMRSAGRTNWSLTVSAWYLTMPAV
jgi:NAD+ synthase (glutamine-hydrolysing)